MNPLQVFLNENGNSVNSENLINHNSINQSVLLAAELEWPSGIQRRACCCDTDGHGFEP